MKSANKLFSFIESVAFTSSAYAANTLASFTVYAESFSEYKQALDNLRQDPSDSAELLAHRVDLLLASQNDENFMHKYDSSIAVYIYLIYQLSPLVFRSRVLSLNLPSNMWWAKQMISVLKKSLNASTTIVHKQNGKLTSRDDTGFNNVMNYKSNSSNELEVVRL